ncbi:TatD family hydrolase [Litoribrevibacter euphylliae]|uniref:TatD family hydrolase n=1 Tax=Litoribrevibacter euphylliae TaxID=1834034 RepID=A0ABV7HDB5_9GAMM
MQNPIEWIDIGVNLSNKQFKDQQAAIIEDATTSGVSKIIITGTDLQESRNAIKLAKTFNQYATAGIHPHDAKENSDSAFQEIAEMMSERCVVAVGETGLDFNRNFSTPEDQQASFLKHIELAKSTGKPMFLHERDAGEAMAALLAEHRSELSNAVIHCFTGSEEDLRRYIDLDVYIGITGWICDERRGFHLHDLIKLIPEDRLMLETDAPYLLPRTLSPKPKNRRNEPKYLPHIGEYIAKLLEIPVEELAAKTTENTKRFFNLD